MQRIWVAVGLVGLLLWGSIWSYQAVDDTVNQVTQSIHQGDFAQAQQLWEKKSGQMGSLLPHEELDQIDVLFARIKAADTPEDWTMDCAELLALLQHLPSMQQPILKNIF